MAAKQARKKDGPKTSVICKACRHPETFHSGKGTRCKALACKCKRMVK